MLPNAHDSHSDLIRTLAGFDTDAAHEAAQKTRRAVRGSLSTYQQQKAGSKRGRTFAIAAAICAVVLLATPIVWNALDDILDDVPWTELHPQMATLLLVLFSAILSALVVAWRSSQQRFRPGRRNF